MATKKPFPFMGKEGKKEEKMEKKMPPAAYKKGEAKEKKANPFAKGKKC